MSTTQAPLVDLKGFGRFWRRLAGLFLALCRSRLGLFLAKGTVAEHRVRHGLGHVKLRLRLGRLVLMLDQKPQLLFALLIGAHKIPDALKFLALQLKLEPAFFQQLYRITDRLPHATVPDDDIARAIVAFRDIPFEGSVIQR